ncbi:hypothetical protein F4604DRAFT_1680935 [Suillus subluteus]|nr:hypothetical protein F4604DRAFT_1680935 [Suillus subluteus]
MPDNYHLTVDEEWYRPTAAVKDIADIRATCGVLQQDTRLQLCHGNKGVTRSSIGEWPVHSLTAQEALDKLNDTHHDYAALIVAYDCANKIIPPHAYQEHLQGTLENLYIADTSITLTSEIPVDLSKITAREQASTSESLISKGAECIYVKAHNAHPRRKQCLLFSSLLAFSDAKRYPGSKLPPVGTENAHTPRSHRNLIFIVATARRLSKQDTKSPPIYAPGFVGIEGTDEMGIGGEVADWGLCAVADVKELY